MKGYCRIFCREDKEAEGNTALIKNGAFPIDENWDCSCLEDIENIISSENTAEKKEKSANTNVQLNLFGK